MQAIWNRVALPRLAPCSFLDGLKPGGCRGTAAPQTIQASPLAVRPSQARRFRLSKAFVPVSRCICRVKALVTIGDVHPSLPGERGARRTGGR